MSKQIKALQILANHRLSLLEQEKSALITLAKKKIQNKKEAKELLTRLEASWKEEKQTMLAEHHQIKEELIQRQNKETSNLKGIIADLQFNLAFKESRIKDLVTEFTETRETLAKVRANCQRYLQNCDE